MNIAIGLMKYDCVKGGRKFMNKIGFVCAWDKDRKNSWSGTQYGLYSSLCKLYDVIDIDVGENRSKFANIHGKILRKISRFVNFDDMGLSTLKSREKVVDRALSGKEKIPLIQFDECPFEYRGRHYIYQDFHVGGVKKLAIEEPETFEISRYRGLELNALDNREHYQRDFYKKVDGIFTMGKWLANELVEKYGIPANKVYHVGGGTNIDVTKIDHSKKQGNKILFVGRDFERKNGPLVVEAFRQAKKIMPELELYIAGPKNLPYDESGIIKLGNVSYEKLADYFNLCDVFCMPSKLEAYGLVFVEALTFGLPCIGRDAYEMPFFIENERTGYLLEKESAEELSKLMLDCISNQQMKKNVISKRDFYINEYSWETVSKRLYNIIESDERHIMNP